MHMYMHAFPCLCAHMHMHMHACAYLQAPLGYCILDEPPDALQLAFSKEASPAADLLVERLVLVKWPSVGWCVGKIIARNFDGRIFKKIDGQRVKVNFIIFYELDQETAKTALRLEDYGGEDEDGSWVMLEECATGSTGGEGGTA